LNDFTPQSAPSPVKIFLVPATFLSLKKSVKNTGIVRKNSLESLPVFPAGGGTHFFRISK
jgi:hypothetical protein